MELPNEPIWDVESNVNIDPDESFVRIRLHEDSVVAEFTIAELCSFFGINGFDCLQRQFKAWYGLDAFAWDSKLKVHCEQIPFSKYFVLSKIHECYSLQPLPEATNGVVRWGMKKK
ncbi:hypothetical protein [Corynebacterium aurimucosum]|uniref:hypothetical protein n=1 Tax=Corynebacterium aurimucosum TaxID=169292 RepID=UPI00055940E7|nr:hypothetical protein [Corynebacterium aurimucosum]QQU94047.1 hypothetical protein I6I67_05100 [Corynebacterium aurimucosum]